MMSHDLVIEIINVLEEETVIYLELLSLSKEKKQFLIDGNTKEINRIVSLERSLAIEVTKLEKNREGIVWKIAKEFNLNADELNISEISKKVGKDYDDILTKKAMRLNEILTEIKSINSVNKELVDQSLDYIGFSLNMLTSIGETDNSYGNSGAAKAAKNKRLFNRNI